jgi:osmotically-inducible protein OsmY
MLDRTTAIALSLAAGLALTACERDDRNALRSDVKKLAQDARSATQNSAQNIEEHTKAAAEKTKESLSRVGDTAGQIVGDATITARVKAALVAEKNVRSTDIDVDTFQGKVILRGTVPDAEQIALAAEIARKVDGVKTVDNRLAVN